MNVYHKINSLYKRDPSGKRMLFGEFSQPEFEYLYINEWVMTEKIDGTNIRVMYSPAFTDGNPYAGIKFGGKTDNAQIPANLANRLIDLFPVKKFEGFGDAMCLYGEGFGAKIQKGGGKYIPNGVDFILFDVRVGDWWLKREDVEDIATKLGIMVVPIVMKGTLGMMEGLCSGGYKSQWGDFPAEGIVARPKIELRDRAGHRIITKLKHKDFK